MQHFIPKDATVADLERKAADAEQKASNESEPGGDSSVIFSKV
jgi:hypothetical protein